VQLSVQADPVTRKLTGSYRVNGGAAVALTSFSTPGEFFSADAAGIDPRIGTRTFAGVYASKRTSTASPVYEFADFSVTGEPVSAATDLEFTKKSHDVDFPTSMAFGPDGRLYVLTLMGDIHVLTFDAQHNVVADQRVTTLGSRLALGIEIDPASTPTNVAVWVAHSSPSLNNGAADSGMITKLSGTNLQNRTDVITGLPRAIANHGPNSLHFGPDGRLYHAVGGNTGAGAANTADTEFGDRAEQPLSAALVVADVKAAGFDGTCADPNDIYSSDDCDVDVYASGLRNTYDFVFHSNGSMYAPDNGLGVVGSYPPNPTPPCRGFGSTVSYKNGGNNPGEQPDELNRIVEGGYYGHPNPTRNECVFGDGSFQGVAPLPNYRPAMHDLGRSRSANGIIEYTDDGFCGALRSQLLVTNYSVGDDIVLLQLAQDGNSVVRSTSLVAGLSDPLPLVQAPDGSLVVGEFGGGKVTTLTPVDTGCWSESIPMPEALLDAGGTAIGDDIYVVGGKTPAGPQSTVRVFDVSAGTWSTRAPLPGSAVENPATVAVGGKLYAFGGSTTPFSGAVGRSAVYDPGTNTWTTLPDMPTPRGGAQALHVNGKIYVVAGMTADGASSAIVEVFDVASRTWSTGPAMSTARDNPGAGVVDGTIYVFGGRTRLANGSTVNGTLSSVEAWSPGAGSWTARAPMPTGRRTMSSAVVGGKILLIGGEGAADGTAFDETERYDPATDTWHRLWPITTPRHGAVAAVVDGLVHVLGGGPTGGGAWTDKHEVFRPPA
jgi:glucose/arabinose dehydrogenase/N-acetylneuraminic acid mutarotase